ncbi:MAG: hypothetical protein KKH98_13495 [Spirochaetes bacterium]|nr:hypothetical protein [Spirochaetota bacterium]
MIVSGEKVLLMAIKIEEVGIDFYHQLHVFTGKKKIFNSILNKLMNDKIKHKKIYQKLLKSIKVKKSQYLKFSKKEIKQIKLFVEGKIFNQIERAKAYISELNDISEVLLYALGFELDSLYFFEQIADKIVPAEKSIIQTIIKEEKSHVDQIILLRTAVRSEETKK